VYSIVSDSASMAIDGWYTQRQNISGSSKFQDAERRYERETPYIDN
jgi:hypothetical protein